MDSGGEGATLNHLKPHAFAPGNLSTDHKISETYEDVLGAPASCSQIPRKDGGSGIVLSPAKVLTMQTADDPSVWIPGP